MKCKFCQKEFEGLRNTAKYCSKRCNTYFHRGVSTTDKLAPQLSTTPNKDSKWERIMKERFGE